MSPDTADDAISELGTREISRRLGAPVSLSPENRAIVEMVKRSLGHNERLEHDPALSVTASTFTMSESVLETIINPARSETATATILD